MIIQQKKRLQLYVAAAVRTYYQINHCYFTSSKSTSVTSESVEDF